MKQAKSLAATLPLALATLLAAGAGAQKPATFTDPANLRGERVSPRDGRELPIDRELDGLQQLLRKLNTRASLMLIVAHPDDEDGGMLTYYSRGLGARVCVLTLNRGEGGQNAMTGDFEDALGLLRTQELLAADRYFGADQMFGTEVDFGFSKTKEESFAKWTHERVLYDAVRAVRLYRPLVIASVFIGGVTDGHGQHQVAGQIAQEVFKAAGDPTVFPELTAEGILPWQPLRVYARVPMQSITDKGLFDYATGQYAPARFTNYVTGEVTTPTPSTDVIVHEGQTDPLLTAASANPADLPPSLAATPSAPLTYVQFARLGLGLQRSQIGPGVRNAPAGAFDISYHLYGSRLTSQSAQPSQLISPQNPAPTARHIPAQGEALGTSAQHGQRTQGPTHNTPPDATFFDGIDTSILGSATLAPSASGNIAVVIKTNLAGISHSIAEAQLDLRPAHPESAANQLAEALKLTTMTIENIERFAPSQLPAAEKTNLLHELRIKRVQLNDALALALNLSLEVTTRQVELPVSTPQLLSVEAPGPLSPRYPPSSVRIETSAGLTFSVPLPAAASASTAKHGNAFTTELPAAFTAQATRPYFTRPIPEQPVYDLQTPALRNASQTPPALTAWASFNYQGVSVEVGRVVHYRRQPVQIIPPAGLSLSAHAQVFPNETPTITFTTQLSPVLSPPVTPAISLPPGWFAHTAVNQGVPGQTRFELTATHRLEATLHASVTPPGLPAITEGFRSIGYGDLPRTNLFTPAAIRIVPVDLKLPAHTRIGYLPGTGDSVPQALASLNLAPTIISVEDLTPTKLASFDTIILGVRTYNAHPDLHGAPTQALFDFARNGGNVIVQFQTPEFTTDDAPFPLVLGRAEVVVDETAPVQLLDATHPLFNFPNKITGTDFNNWIEERGHGFLRQWDPHYTVLTETHDPGQAPQKGGLVTTALGKGRWTYVAFALYRQLPEAVPGAFRLFANLLNP